MLTPLIVYVATLSKNRWRLSCMWFISPLRMGFRFYLSHLFTQSYLVSHRSLHHIYPVGTVLLHFFNFLWSSSSQSCCIFSIFFNFFVVIQLPLLCFPWVVLGQINLLYIVTDFLINKIIFRLFIIKGLCCLHPSKLSGAWDYLLLLLNFCTIFCQDSPVLWHPLTSN